MTGGADLSARDARWLAIDAQGLGRPRRRSPVQRGHVRAVMDSIKVLQLDAINVLERTQFLVLFSRLGPYDTDLLHRMTGPGCELFEYWGHAASLLPVEHEPLLRWRMDEGGPYSAPKYVAGRETWRAEHVDYIDAVRREVRDRGPLAASQLVDPRRSDGEWWARRSLGRQALEGLFATGELAGWRTPGFERVYDLRERVIPDAIRAVPTPSTEEAQRRLLELAAGALGVATARDLADYHRIRGRAVAERVAELVHEGALVEVSVEGWSQPAYMATATRLRRPTRDHATLLSPFDSLIWDRKRTERLFDFDYRIEVYVHAPDRRYGYFVLPLMLGDEIVARFDLKADRKASVLRVQAAYLEPGMDEGVVANAAAAELRALGGWLGLDGVAVGRRGAFTSVLRRSLR